MYLIAYPVFWFLLWVCLPRLYLKRGLARCRRGDYDRAIADFHEAIVRKPDGGEAYYNRALAWYAKRCYNEAWADVKRYRELGGTPEPALIERLQKASGRRE